MKLNFFKLRVRAIAGFFFYFYNQKMCKRGFFKFIKVRFENKYLKYEKKEKLSFEIRFWVKNGKLIKKMRTGNFFLSTTKIRAKESSLISSKSNLKNKSLSTKRRKKLTLEVSILVKKGTFS